MGGQVPRLSQQRGGAPQPTTHRDPVLYEPVPSGTPGYQGHGEPQVFSTGHPTRYPHQYTVHGY